VEVECKVLAALRMAILSEVVNEKQKTVAEVRRDMSC
jgi:hypothetical protein